MTVDDTPDAAEYARRVAVNIERFRHEAGMTISQVIDESGIGRSVFYSKIKNESSWTLDGLARVADVFAIELHELLQETPAPADPDTALVDGIVLGRRLTLLLRTAEGVPGEEELVTRMEAAGVPITPEIWRSFTSSTRRMRVPRSVLAGVATYFGIDPAYLTSPAGDPVADHLEAQLELQEALRATGDGTIRLRALGEISTNDLRAIARSVRSVGEKNTPRS